MKVFDGMFLHTLLYTREMLAYIKGYPKCVTPFIGFSRESYTGWGRVSRGRSMGVAFYEVLKGVVV